MILVQGKNLFVKPRVVALVVAYNRRDLLNECLDAISNQTRRPDEILVIDNCSDDDSAALASGHRSQPIVVSLSRNTGGAGGFAAGIAYAVDRLNADHVWLMDDDTIPTPTALDESLKAKTDYGFPVAIVGSRAVWTDGRDHPMNTPRTRPGATRADRMRADAVHAIPVRSSSFVSMLVEAQAIRYYGLPEADYFLWNDDFEYSCRLLKDSVGLFARDSVVEHRSKSFGATDADPGERFYYEVRNKVWMFFLSPALKLWERPTYALASVRRWIRTFRKSSDRKVLLRVGLRGLRDGVMLRPRPVEVVLAGEGDVTGAVEAVQAGRRA